jgi:branched-chain amino acid transport system ATP-binding protein
MPTLGRNTLLRLNNVSAHYGDLQALRDVSITIRAGEIISIIGSNGAGKTTMINAISGVLRCSSGAIQFMGGDIKNLPTHEIVAKGIIQVPEGRLLFPFMTVMENLKLGAFNQRSRRQSKERMERIYDLYPLLKERRDQLAGTLSGGEQQMLAIARGLMADPQLIMLDEPSLGLAPIVVKSVFQTIKQIRSSGITVLFVEQNVFQSLSINDRAYVIENGSIVMEGTGSDLLNNPRIKNAYLGI